MTAVAAESLKTMLARAFSWPCVSGCSAPVPGWGSAGHQPDWHIGLGPLQSRKADAQKAHATLPAGINLPATACRAEGKTLETARQPSDGDEQMHPNDPIRFAPITARQQEDPGFLITEQLLTAEKAGRCPATTR